MKALPRLDGSWVDALIAQHEDAPIGEVITELRTSVEISVVSPKRQPERLAGLEHISERELTSLRKEIVATAESFGYPEPQAGALTGFDRQAAAILLSELPITGADAGAKTVWLHMNGWLLADVVAWRWNGMSADRFGTSHRWRARNQFGRLWWAAHQLGSVFADGLIGADQIGAITERSSVGGDPRLAKCIAETWVDLKDQLPKEHEEFMRNAVKRVRRLLPSTALYSISDEALHAHVTACFERALEDFEAPQEGT